jgi:glycosyltransferase involved in cell wall biosynthesis
MKIAMVTIGFPPEDVGGTETYVLGLIQSLHKIGCRCEVVYMIPRKLDSSSDFRWVRRDYRDIPVHTLEVDHSIKALHSLISDPEGTSKIVDAMVEKLVALKPDLVHFHPLQLNFESRIIQSLKDKGIPTLLTFHSSTTTCMRGDLVQFGRAACDGKVIFSRCLACYLHSKKIPKLAAEYLGEISLEAYRGLYDDLRETQILSKVQSLLSLPLMLEDRMKSWEDITRNVDALVAVCEWVKSNALSNGAPPFKTYLSRHGLRLRANPVKNSRTSDKVQQSITYGYLGRLSHEKGIDTLIQALRLVSPEVSFKIQICSSSLTKTELKHGDREAVREILQYAAMDPRVELIGSVDDDSLPETLAQWDAIIVPSFWFESGPMVVYEAFSAGTPVIGSRRGGIAELVEEGRTGFLFTPSSATELARLLEENAQFPERLRAMRSNIPPQRTFDDVAREMQALYHSILLPK